MTQSNVISAAYRREKAANPTSTSDQRQKPCAVFLPLCDWLWQKHWLFFSFFFFFFLIFEFYFIYFLYSRFLLVIYFIILVYICQSQSPNPLAVLMSKDTGHAPQGMIQAYAHYLPNLCTQELCKAIFRGELMLQQEASPRHRDQHL